MLRSILLSFLLWFSILPTQAQTILVWGDSLSAGYGLGAGEAWPNLLQSRLRAHGFPHEVVNASVSGETSAGGRSRLARALADYKPAILVLALGANDGLRGLPAELMAENLTAMLDLGRKAGTRNLLVGMEMPPNFGRAYGERFRQTYAQVAKATRTPLIPFLLAGFATRPEMFQGDGLHPVAAAQPLIVDTLWPALGPLLGTPKP